MEIDQAKTEEQDDDEAPEPVTPDQSDDETDGEDELAPQTEARSSETPRGTSVVAQGSKGKATESEGVPPPRALPFSKLVDRRKEAEKSVVDDEDDETEDEEL